MGLDMYEKSLQIKTNTNTDSDKIRIDFYKSEGTRTIGQLQIRVAQGAYKIKDCNNDFVLFSLQRRGASESAGNPNAKIWSIFIREERLKIRCNGELLLDHCLCQVDCNIYLHNE